MTATLNYITPLEGELKAAVSLFSQQLNAGYWVMKVQLFYSGEPAGTTSFTLQGYSREEAEEVALNLPRNAFLMREIDEFLSGESD